MTITSIDRISKNSFVAALILLKYEDYNSFVKIFRYLNECIISTQKLFI